jgi:hypothetical protein
MSVSEFCKLLLESNHGVKVTVKRGDKKSTKSLYVAGYNGEGDGSGKDYILFRDSIHYSEYSTYRTFYMRDVRSFNAVLHTLNFEEGVLPYEIDGQPFVSR